MLVVESTCSIAPSGKKAKKAQPQKVAVKVKEVLPPATEDSGDEGEYEVESIRAHQWVSPCLNEICINVCLHSNHVTHPLRFQAWAPSTCTI